MRPPDEALSIGSYADWKRRAGELLKFRGPKW
jgi:hypothetical protein